MKERLIACLQEYDQFLHDAKLIRDLRLPEGYIAAGYIRNSIWDRLHRYNFRHLHNDIDVVFFDPQDISEERDDQVTRWLVSETGNSKWSVKNQARMHIRNGHRPYKDISDALRRWPETATAVAARITEEGQLDVVSPHGLDDLFGLVVRRSPYFSNKDYYLKRISGKNWKEQWPQLTILED